MESDFRAIERWLDSLKIALLESNADEAYNLTQNLPFNMEYFENNTNIEPVMLEYLNMASELISQSIELLQNSKEEARIQLHRIRQVKNFFI